VAEALEGLVDLHVRQPTVDGLTRLEMFVKAPLRRLEAEVEEGKEGGREGGREGGPEEERRRVQACLEKVRAKLLEVKEGRKG